MKKWRVQPTRYFATRPIFKEEIPKLVKAMIEDGVMALITPKGIQWYHAEYKVPKTSICDVWNLSGSQLKRVEDYIYGHDPFVREQE